MADEATATQPKKRRRRRGGESMSGFFRDRFRQRPELLESGSNDEIMQMWKDAHPGHTAKQLKQAKGGMANTKSLLRRDVREGKIDLGNGAGRGRGNASKHSTNAGLPALELAIDECLIMACNLDRQGLGQVIDLLRQARNRVVWKIGK